MYLGNIPSTSFEAVKKDRFTGLTGTGVTLSHSVSSVQDIVVWVNNVKQDYNNYTVSNTALTLGGSLVSADVVQVLYVGRTFQTVNPAADSVTASQIADNAISEEHLDPTIITGLTALASEPADTDEFLVSDAGTLKRIDYSLIKGSGKVLKIDNQINNTRTAISSATSKTTILSGTYTNVQASSKVLITIKMPMHGSEAGAMGVGFTWNSTDYDGALTYTYENTDNLTKAIMNKSFDNPASTGSISWVIYFKTANSANARPTKVINPNSTEDARLPQQETQLTFMEYTT